MTAIGTFFPYGFERRMTPFAVNLPVKEIAYQRKIF
ncbi:MAG: hypothetical protein ACJAUR_001942 [Ulvibacter sp.]|jgi:hypothetical protein